MGGGSVVVVVVSTGSVVTVVGMSSVVTVVLDVDPDDRTVVVVDRVTGLVTRRRVS